MAELTIRLQIDPATGKRDVIIGLRSDADALPHEHEQQHKALVEKLLAQGVLTAEQVGKILVERLPEGPVAEAPPAAQPAGEQRQARESAE